jgi:hypothetical protein
VNATDLVLQFVDALHAAGVQYMLVGSYSSNFYGRPRSTKNADFVAEINEGQLKTIGAALGADFLADRQLTFETVTMTTRYVVHHASTAFKIELFQLSPSPELGPRMLWMFPAYWRLVARRSI